MKVRCNGLGSPRQNPTSRGFKTKVDCYITQLSKFPSEPAVGHSKLEMLYWGILEGDPTVRYMVPQPYKFMLGTKRYTPDLYYEKKGKRLIVEIKSEESFKKFKQTSNGIREFLKNTPYEFVHVTNESIAEREVFARNWLIIAHTLVTSTYVDTTKASENILDRLRASPLQVGDIIDIHHRVDEAQSEIALFRLANLGMVELDLECQRLSANTGVRICQ